MGRCRGGRPRCAGCSAVPRRARWVHRPSAQAARLLAETGLGHLCQPWREPRVPQTPLCARIIKHLASLFVFVAGERRLPNQQCRRAQPAAPGDDAQDQWGHPLSPRNDHPAGAGLPGRHLASARRRSLPRHLRAARLPTTLNSYPNRGERCRHHTTSTNVEVKSRHEIRCDAFFPGA